MTDADMAGLDAEWEEARKKRNGNGSTTRCHRRASLCLTCAGSWLTSMITRSGIC